ncbi:MAG: DegT/DnrJ/EryC1/StrS family aminotransferase, partial [candidate division Zixibacteria bacterium]|nr:DegT/DnrJ/EryC1/StrS family aminotransferase [candidate division Zixibacteria bacterium]
KYLAELYDRHLTPYLDMLELPPRNSHSEHAWHMYLIRLKPKGLKIGRDELLRQLASRGIGTSVHFIPVHLHPFYRKFLGYKSADFPNALATYKRIFTPPFYPAMSDADVEYVSSTIGEILKANYQSSSVPVETKKKAAVAG